MTGRAFLHLREGDLEELGINILWRKALLEARDRLKRESAGGRTYLGLEGPPLEAPDPVRARQTSSSRRLSDAGSVASEAGEAVKEEWKTSWRRRPAKGSTSKVDSLRQTFERGKTDATSRNEHDGDEATGRTRTSSIGQIASHGSITAIWPFASVGGASHNVSAGLSPVLSAADTSIPADGSADDDFEPPSSFSASPDSLTTWTPIPFLTGAGLKSRAATFARDEDAFVSSARSRHSPDTLRTRSPFDSWLRPNAALSPSRARPAAAEAGIMDEDELDTVRPVKSPEPHPPASDGHASPVRAQDPSALAQLFGLELPRSPPTRPIRDMLRGGHARPDGSEDELVPMLVPPADDVRHERDMFDGGSSVRRKKGSLVLVRSTDLSRLSRTASPGALTRCCWTESQFVALQSRMREVEAQLSAVLVASPSLDEPVSVDDPGGTWQFKGEEISSEELLQLDAQMRRSVMILPRSLARCSCDGPADGGVQGLQTRSGVIPDPTRFRRSISR